jgi:hypothetical protein
MEAIIGIILVILGIVLYCAAVMAYFVYVVPFIAGAEAIAAVGLILYLYAEALIATVRKTPRIAEGPEPAVKQYFYATAWRELVLSITKTHQQALVFSQQAVGWGLALFKQEPQAATFPIGFGLIVAGGASTIVGYVVFGAGILVHSVILAVCVSISGTIVGILRSTELVSMLIRRIYLVCPSRDCHLPIPLPVYRCPKCGATHKSLMPGSYGAFQRRCQCGEWLPTLFILGRSRIPAFCPHVACGRPLNDAIGSARNVHIPVVGGPFVGKTAFLTATMLEIRKKNSARMTFPEHSDEAAFDAAAQRFARGITVEKTIGASPNAMLVRVEDVHQGQSLLYIYDAAGELYAGTSDLRRQNFFTHAHAVALLIDPFSITEVRTNRARDLIALGPEIRASGEAPENVYSRLVMTLREQRKDSRISVPLAIIVTKVDAIGIEDEIAEIARAFAASAAATGNKKTPDAVREWLVRHGEGNLVRSAETDFKKVRYFACSALGRMPSISTGAFKSRGVLAPFEWLAETNGVRFT